MVLGVISGKGGTGKTKVAAGLAVALSSLGKNVIVVGCRFGGTIDMELGCSDRCIFTFSDIGDGSVEKAVVNLENLWVCPPPSHEQFDYDTALELIVRDYGHYDFIILDDPPSSCLIDCGIIVTTPSPADVRGASRVGYEYKSNGVDCRLIVNKLPLLEGVRCDVSSIIDSTYSPIVGALPFTWNYTEKERESILNIVYGNIAKRLLGMSVPLFAGLKHEKKLRGLIG